MKENIPLSSHSRKKSNNFDNIIVKLKKNIN